MCAWVDSPAEAGNIATLPKPEGIDGNFRFVGDLS